MIDGIATITIKFYSHYLYVVRSILNFNVHVTVVVKIITLSAGHDLFT